MKGVVDVQNLGSTSNRDCGSYRRPAPCGKYRKAGAFDLCSWNTILVVRVDGWDARKCGILQSRSGMGLSLQIQTLKVCCGCARHWHIEQFIGAAHGFGCRARC